jgi:hypothetical protein
MDESYKDVANTNRGGVMVPDEKRGHRIIKPSKKGIKKAGARLLKELKEEHYVTPHIAQSEIFFIKFMQPQKAVKIGKKKGVLSEGAFGSKNGSTQAGDTLN